MTLLRKVEKETRLGRLVLPRGVQVVIPTAAIHHDEELWGRSVDDFKPERFSEGIAKATERNPGGGTYLPFGLGPRSCVGMNFALNEAKIAISMILQRFSFTLSPAYAHSPAMLLTIAPQHGLQLILHPLSTHQ